MEGDRLRLSVRVTPKAGADAVEGFRTVLLGIMDDDRLEQFSADGPDRPRRAG